MYDATEPRAERAPREVWHFRNGRLRQDSGNRLASVRNANFGGFADPFARIVVELADADCFHVTQRVTWVSDLSIGSRAMVFPMPRCVG